MTDFSFTKEDIDEAAANTLVKVDEFYKQMGDNCFPCGGAWLTIGGRSEFVRFMKKFGQKSDRCNFNVFNFPSNDNSLIYK